MIARVWHGVVAAEKTDAYEAFLNRIVLPEYRDTPGNRGVLVLRRPEREGVGFLLVSYWESLDAVRAFAGPEVERAHFHPEALAFLIDPEPVATHFDVLPSSDLPAG